MRLESLDGLGACTPKENKILTYVLPASQIKSMGLTSTESALAEANVPYVKTSDTIVAAGQTLPTYIPTSTKDHVVAALKKSLTAVAELPAKVADAASELTTTEKKAIGFTALALLALAALASQFKSKPGAMNGVPKGKKLAFIKL